MGFKNGCICTLWKNKSTQNIIDKYEKYAVLSISTSKKNLSTGQYDHDFSGKVRFLGKAFTKIKDAELAEKDKLKLLEVETTNRYDKESNRNYTNYVCWDFEFAGETKPIEPNKVDIVEGDGGDPFDNLGDNLPF